MSPKASTTVIPNFSSSGSQTTLDNMIAWKNNVSVVNQDIFTGPISDLPSGQYTLVLTVKDPHNAGNYYRWVTHLNIP